MQLMAKSRWNSIVINGPPTLNFQHRHCLSRASFFSSRESFSEGVFLKFLLGRTVNLDRAVFAIHSAPHFQGQSLKLFPIMNWIWYRPSRSPYSSDLPKRLLWTLFSPNFWNIRITSHMTQSPESLNVLEYDFKITAYTWNTLRYLFSPDVYTYRHFCPWKFFGLAPGGYQIGITNFTTVSVPLSWHPRIPAFF